jgi:hypothetical protein
MTEQTNNTKDLKFYSQKAIAIATFFGGPLAAGYLIRENYLSLEDSENGNSSLVIGIIATMLLFIGIFSIPDSIMNKIPNQILPAIYTGIIYLIVKKIHTELLNQHKENGNEFYSVWKAVGIGVISLAILSVGIFGYAYLSTDHELYEKYDKEMAVFTINESETLAFYDDLNSKSRLSLIRKLDRSIIPKWEDNIGIIEKTNAFENLPEELVDQNKILTEYAELRLEAFRLLRKAIQEDTDKYVIELDDLHFKIDTVLEKLN